MQNRRQHYRHAFAPNHRLRAMLTKQDSVTSHTGEIVNLSVGGVCVKLDESVPVLEGNWLIQFTLNETSDAVHVRVERVHTQKDHERGLGLRFLFPIHVPTRDDLERRISKYLIDVQRYERRLLREEKNSI